MTSVRLDWPVLGRDDWRALVDKCPRSNLFQTWDYGNAVAADEGYRPRRGLIYRDRRVVGFVQVFVRNRWGVAAAAKLVRGPLFLALDPPADQAADAIGQIKRAFPIWKRTILRLMPEVLEGPDAEAVSQAARLNRVKSGYTTAWIDLTRKPAALRAALSQSWRNQLGTAERSGLTVDDTTDAQARDWLLEAYERHKAEIGYQGPSAALLARLPLADLRIRRALIDGSPVAGTLFIRHGRCATYQAGWSGPEGRSAHAHKRLVWETLGALKTEGVEAVDLGGLDDANAPGVAHFKRGLGGEEVTLMGTFV